MRALPDKYYSGQSENGDKNTWKIDLEKEGSTAGSLQVEEDGSSSIVQCSSSSTNFIATSLKETFRAAVCHVLH